MGSRNLLDWDACCGSHVDGVCVRGVVWNLSFGLLSLDVITGDAVSRSRHHQQNKSSHQNGHSVKDEILP